MERKPEIKTVEAYIASFPETIARRMESIRAVIKNTVPHAQEKISYLIPTYALEGNLVHFMAAKNHIGFYPGPTGITAFEPELTVYKKGKGSIQFPHKEPLPLDIIAKITKYRAAENLDIAAAKKKKTK